MMRSLYSGVSGLKNHQTRMDVVGNNISNVNTTGFKSGRVTFVDTLNQTLSGASSATDTTGGTNPKQIGLGSGVSAIDTLFTDGSVQSTGVNTDLCLSGNGLFVVNNGANTYYTRNGNFKFDEKGNYVNSEGLTVQGWMADSDGNINTQGQLEGIQIPSGKSMAAAATTKADYSSNLNSGTQSYTVANVTVTYADGTSSSTTDYNPTLTGRQYTFGGKVVSSVTVNTTDGTTQTGLIGTRTQTNDTFYPSVSTTITAYDSLGNAHTVPVLMTKTADNTWDLSLAGGTEVVDITESDGSITQIDLTKTALRFDSSGRYVSGSASLSLAYTNGNGAASQNITLNLAAMTQYAGSSTAFGTADGHTQGTLKSVSVDSSGIITGTYTNGVNHTEGQVAVAQFNNQAGLTKVGQSLYTVSNNSGTPNINTANSLGVTITPSSLEMSNVDLASELTDMIVTQRGYQSNSKIITVSDELLETLINMKR